MVYLMLNKGYVERTMKEANEQAINELGEEDGKDTLMWDLNDSKDKLEEIGEDGSLSVVSASEIGSIDIYLKLSVSNDIDIIESIVKRLNKFKTMLESLK